MPTQLLNSTLFQAAVILGVFGAVLIVLGIGALMRTNISQFALRVLVGLLLLAIGALSGTISAGMQGYTALTREDVAARISVKPTTPKRFAATIRLANGREATFELAGDEIYIDAHILKMTPYANWLGLHTAYELDRVSGRYLNIQDEASQPRTVHALHPTRVVDLFALRRRYTFLSPFLDAESGSATFVAVSTPAELEVRVSTTGLLIREAKPAEKP